jgi:hypothetical protein
VLSAESQHSGDTASSSEWKVKLSKKTENSMEETQIAVKYQVTFTELHVVIFQRTELFTLF